MQSILYRFIIWLRLKSHTVAMGFLVGSTLQHAHSLGKKYDKNWNGDEDDDNPLKFFLLSSDFLVVATSFWEDSLCWIFNGKYGKDKKRHDCIAFLPEKRQARMVTVIHGKGIEKNDDDAVRASLS